MTHEKIIENGMNLLSNNQIEEAIREFKVALKTDASNYEGLLNIGIAYGRLGKHQEAIIWLQKLLHSFPDDAKALYNMAIGYRWQIKPRVLFLMGLRTDFNNIKDYDYGDMEKYETLTSSSMNIYHATGGVQFHYKKHQLIAGTQMSFGRQKNIEQMANFGDDYQPDFNDDMPLLGVRENVADIYYFSLSIFLGATLNFESKKQLPKE